MVFWISALQTAAKMDRMKAAEAKLLQFAREFGDRPAYEYRLTTVDTNIPRDAVIYHGTEENSNSENSIWSRWMGIDADRNEEEDYIIHAIKLEPVKSDNSTTPGEPPLVLLHGYANASAYFYRNLVGLSHAFSTIYSLDMLGWGMSSRPDFEALVPVADSDDDRRTVAAAEHFFVESLEAWRKENSVPKMILAGHSMGGYMSVAYCEKYPQHVEKLILLSPVGVPEETEDVKERRAAMQQQASWKMWGIMKVARNVFDKHTPGKVVRSMPTQMGEKMTLNYVEKRLPAIDTVEEQAAVSEYLYANNTLFGSGEHCLNRVLTPFAMAKQPLEHRIPHLKVTSVSFIYGTSDWMDPKGGAITQFRSEQIRLAQEWAPNIEVYLVEQAGHLLMLDNWAQTNYAVVLGAGMDPTKLMPYASSMPTKLDPKDFVESIPSSFPPQYDQPQQSPELPPAQAQAVA